MEIRRTCSSDLPRLHDIFSRAMGALFEPRGLEPPAPPFDVFAAQQEHLLAHDTERCVVAVAAGEPVAYASAWIRGRDWFLASLFVDPDVQGRGLGAALLDAVWGADDLHRRTITDAIQPVSNALYGRRGLIPATPILEFAGVPRPAATPRGLEAGVATPAALRALDFAAYGFDRTVDHAFWVRVAECTVWCRDGEPVAYGYRFPGGLVGPVAGVDGRAAGDALMAELARAAGTDVRVRMPGSARELVGAALAAGLRLGPLPGLLLLGPGLDPPKALALASYTLL